MLCAKLRGHYGYYGITGNAAGIRSFYAEVRREWRKWLSRRAPAHAPSTSAARSTSPGATQRIIP